MISFIKSKYKYLIIILFIIIISIIFYLIDTEPKKIDKKVKNIIVEKKEEKEEEETTFFVDVKGAVNYPGVYELQKGKRVIDAINQAGGLLDVSDTINLNLSKKVIDEMYIVVYTKEELYNYENNKMNKNCPSFECVCPDVKNDACISNGNNDSNLSLDGKISINSATKEELMKLQGIGESKANAIISYRNQNGGFKSLDEIKSVQGIGEAVFDKIKDNITL